MRAKNKTYVLGNCLRGAVEGRFSSPEIAWEVLSRRFLMSYPSTGGRWVSMMVHEVNPYGIKQYLYMKYGITQLDCSWNDKKVAARAKYSQVRV